MGEIFGAVLRGVWLLSVAEILTLSVLTAERKASIIHRAGIKE